MRLENCVGTEITSALAVDGAPSASGMSRTIANTATRAKILPLKYCKRDCSLSMCNSFPPFQAHPREQDHDLVHAASQLAIGVPSTGTRLHEPDQCGRTGSGLRRFAMN